MHANRVLRKASFKKKLFYYSLAISVVPVIILGAISSWVASHTVQQEVNANHQIILKQMQGRIDDFLKNLEKSSMAIATNVAVEKSVDIGPSVRNLGETMDMINSIQRQRSYSDINYDVSLLFSKFHKVYSTRLGYIEESDFPYTDMIKMIRTRYNSTVFVPPNTFPDQNEFLLLRPVPVLFEEAASGILVLHIEAERFNSLINQVQLGNNRKLLIVNGEGTVIAGQQPAEIGAKLASTSELYRFWTNPDSRPQPLSLGGVEYNLSAQKSAYNDWTYIAMTPSNQLKQKAYFLQSVTWTMVILIVLLWLFVAMIGSKRLYKPVQKLLTTFSGEAKLGGKDTDGLEQLDSFIQQLVRTNDRLRSQVSEQMPYIKDSVSLQLLRGELPEKELRQKAEQISFPLNGERFYVCLADMDEFYLFQKEFNEKDRSLLMYSLRKMVEEIYEESFSIVTANPSPGQIAAVIAVGKADDRSDADVRLAAAEILEKVRQYFPFTVTVSVSGPRQMLAGVHHAYREASELLGYRLLLGHDRLISRLEIEPSVQQSRVTIVRWQKKIVASLANGQMEDAEAELTEMVKSVPQYVRNSETVLGLFAYLIGELEFLIVNAGQESANLFEQDPYKQLYGMTSLADITEWLTGTIFPAIVRHIQGMDKMRRTVQQVLLHMKEHYESDLSLQQVADRFDISHFQLSKAFKETTGSNFSDYLIQFRMEKAKEWLVHTDMPIKEIAERLRYATVQNLSRIFKQIVGVPPGQYRKTYRE